MEILLLLLTHAVAVIGGIVIGVHNAKSSTIKPLAEKAQKVGRKAIRKLSKE